MPHPILFLLGYLKLRIPAESAGAAVDIMGRASRIYRDFSFSDGWAFFECSLISARRTLSLLRQSGIEAEIYSRHGMPNLLWRYRHRYGIFAGAVIFLLITVLSSTVLWDVRVVGNVTADADDIKKELSACGLTLGMPIASIDTPTIETTVLIESDTIAWISINITGNVATAEIREAVPEPVENDYFSADVVAERDGVVEWFEDMGGNALVGIGDSVKKGDVLISGYYPEEEFVGERYTVARGKVFARTERDFSVSIPLTYDKKEYTGRKKCEKYIILFEKEVKIFGNSGNLYANCDTIDTIEYFELGRGVLLPFGVRTVEYSEYETVSAQRSRESAVELAYYRLRCLMADGVIDGMLTKKQIRADFREDSYELTCHAQYIENIARVVGTEERGPQTEGQN